MLKLEASSTAFPHIWLELLLTAVAGPSPIGDLNLACLPPVSSPKAFCKGHLACHLQISKEGAR